MDTSLLKSFNLRQFCQALSPGVATSGECPDLRMERYKRMLAGFSAEECEGLAREVEVQLVSQSLGALYATSSCGNCKNLECCDTHGAKRFSVERLVHFEPWKAFLCNGYEPDVAGLLRETRQLKEITALLQGIGVPIDDAIVGRYLERSTHHWFHELKITGPVGLPREGFTGYNSFRNTTMDDPSAR